MDGLYTYRVECKGKSTMHSYIIALLVNYIVIAIAPYNDVAMCKHIATFVSYNSLK